MTRARTKALQAWANQLFKMCNSYSPMHGLLAQLNTLCVLKREPQDPLQVMGETGTKKGESKPQKQEKKGRSYLEPLNVPRQNSRTIQHQNSHTIQCWRPAEPRIVEHVRHMSLPLLSLYSQATGLFAWSHGLTGTLRKRCDVDARDPTT
jgi:hypothetical protein